MAARCLKRIAIARLVFPARNRQAHLPAPSFCWNILVFCYKGVAIALLAGMSHNLWHILECTGVVKGLRGILTRKKVEWKWRGR
jgi:hypothetical protein